MNLTFTSDTKHRKQFFTGVSFSHPAKMLLPLELWLIENYSKPGDVILDPMSGSGTVLVACSMGRDVICVELEAKFIEIIKGNWQKIQERGAMLGCTMGKAQIIQGDARNLTGLLVDSCIFSPPFAEAGRQLGKTPLNAPRTNPRRKGEKLDWVDYAGYEDNGNIANLPYGKLADVILTSPPYASGGHHADQTGSWGGQAQSLTKEQANYGQSKGQIGQLRYGSIDAVITSPPYAGTVNAGTGGIDWEKAGRPDKAIPSPNKFHTGFGVGEFRYSADPSNIGNLKSTSYLAAMLQVYQQCFKVLKDGGLLCLVTKDFIRNRKRVDLAADTIRLCERAGFTFKERHYRKLTAQSFWRVIYRQKYPDSPVLDTEDILIFVKAL